MLSLKDKVKQTVHRYEFEHDIFGSIYVDDFWDKRGHYGISIYDDTGKDLTDDKTISDEVWKFLEKEGR